MNWTSTTSKDKALVLAFGALAALMVGLAIVGAVRSYSPVPFKDMWVGYLNFYMDVSDGNISAWWAKHNEHRIIIPRILFWIDFKYFTGTMWFLVAVNYLIVFASAVLFWRILRAAAATEKPATAEILLGFFVTAWLFLWIQGSNLSWGFQSQFFLAQLLPLCAFYCLQKSIVATHPNRHFFVACSLGLASLGTMANGVLALPLMTLYALIMRHGVIRIGILASLSVIMPYLYFQDSQPSLLHDKSLELIKQNPLSLAHYVLLYLGSPFYFLSGKGAFGKLVAIVASLFLVGSSAWFAVKSLYKPSENALKLALLLFILFIGGSALGTATGRLVLGVDQAMSGRYTTPIIMAWAALLLLYLPTVLATVKAKGEKVLLPFAVLAFPLVYMQFLAVSSQDETLFERKIAALALELQVNDQKQISNVYIHKVERSLAAAQKASALNLSIFGVYPFRDAREQLGVVMPQITLPICQGRLDKVEAIEGDAQFVHVSGWIFNDANNTMPQFVRFLDSQHRVVGYALSGLTRQDQADIIGKNALKVGFKGYLFADQKGTKLTLQGEQPGCQLQVNVPQIDHE